MMDTLPLALQVEGYSPNIAGVCKNEAVIEAAHCFRDPADPTAPFCKTLLPVLGVWELYTTVYTPDLRRLQLSQNDVIYVRINCNFSITTNNEFSRGGVLTITLFDSRYALTPTELPLDEQISSNRISIGAPTAYVSADLPSPQVQSSLALQESWTWQVTNVEANGPWKIGDAIEFHVILRSNSYRATWFQV